jgi:opacity protein-like surface antigen
MLKYFCFLILLTLPISTYSQQFEGGFFGGFSASQIDGDTYSGYNKLGFTSGAYATRELTRNLNLKLEFRYIQKGANKKVTENSMSIDKTKLQYAEIPLLLQYFYNKEIFLEGGLIPEFLLASAEDFGDGYIDPTNPFHRFSLEGALGAGYFISNHIAIGARYSYSLLPARDHASGQILRLNLGQRNNVISFSLYYHFR